MFRTISRMTIGHQKYSGICYQEYQYINLIRTILRDGEIQLGRNGTTKHIFGTSMDFSLDHQFPLLTTKKVAWKTCLKELLWFIRGSTDNNELVNQNVHIWNQNATREFLDSRGLYHLNENDLGPIYGYQWRNFNKPYHSHHLHYSYNESSVDQLDMIIKCLKDPEKRYSRRLLLTAWNPLQLHEMALPPCHVMAQFNVSGTPEDPHLSCAMFQRSADVGLGMPFNIASYSFFTYLLAHYCNMTPKHLTYFIGNAHIYENHIPMLEKQIERIPFPFPTLSIESNDTDTDTVKKIEEYKVSDFKLHNYKHHSSLNMNMVA